MSWCSVCGGGVGVLHGSGRDKKRTGKWESREGARQDGDTTVVHGYESHNGNLSSIPCRPLTDVDH